MERLRERTAAFAAGEWGDQKKRQAHVFTPPHRSLLLPTRGEYAIIRGVSIPRTSKKFRRDANERRLISSHLVSSAPLYLPLLLLDAAFLPSRQIQRTHTQRPRLWKLQPQSPRKSTKHLCEQTQQKKETKKKRGGQAGSTARLTL